MASMKNTELPEVPNGFVRVIDDAKLDNITLTENGFEMEYEIYEYHYERE